MMAYYTGVGSRAAPDREMRLMEEIANACREKGIVLRSGGALGADTAFENGSGNLKEIFLPWKGYNENKSPLFQMKHDSKAEDYAKAVHTHWGNLKAGGRKMHIRNVYQVFGQNLDTPSDFLVCWTEGGKTIGGTATAIRLAESIQIPVFNIGKIIEFDHAMRFIKENYEIRNRQRSSS